MVNFKIPGFDYPIPSGDKSIEMLKALFGGVGKLDGSLGVLSSVFGLFNGSIMAIGSVLAFYMIVSAVVQTAHDGEVLGKRFSSLWVPLRGVGATSLLVPVYGGFSAIQALVIAIAMGGVSLADKMTSVGLDAVMANQGFISPAVAQRKTGEELSKGIFSIAACMTANERSAARAGYTPQPVISYTPSLTGAEVISIAVSADGSKASCGEITVGKNSSFSFDDMTRTIQQTQAAAALTLYKQAKQATDSIQTGVKTNFDFINYRNQVVAQHDKQLSDMLTALAKTASSDAGQKHKAELEKIKSEGWVSLGGSALRLASISSEISANIKLGQAQARGFNTSIFGPADEGGVLAEKALILSQLNDGSDSKIGANDTDESSSPLVDKVIGVITEPLYTVMEGWVNAGNSSGNPLLAIKNKGDALMSAGTLALPAGFLASMVPSMGAAFTFVLPICLTMILIGGMMAIWIPLIPWIFGISIALAYLISVFEAMVASPLWLLMFYNGEGEGLREGDSAWKFLIATLLRPALTVMAFFAASIVVITVGGWATDAFLSLFKSTHNSGFGALPATLGYAYIYASVMILIVNKSYRMMLEAPEAILKWLGSSLTGVSDDTAEVQQNNTLIMAQMGGAGRQVGGAVSGKLEDRANKKLEEGQKKPTHD